ncbi:hypothetical protein TNCV_4280381 [Trichonephila clavipes]|nr:hypothetical protein TNCV_4280381 [Trichonephila clavipes]
MGYNAHLPSPHTFEVKGRSNNTGPHQQTPRLRPSQNFEIKKVYILVIMPTYPPSYVRSEGPEERHRTLSTDITTPAFTKNLKRKKVYISAIMPTYPSSYARSEGPEEPHRTSSTDTTSPTLTKIRNKKKVYISVKRPTYPPA